MSEGYPELLVVDASVAAKWYVPEELYERAAGVLEAGARGEARLIAPDLLGPELGKRTLAPAGRRDPGARP